MCDNDSFDDLVAYRLRPDLLSRRGFGSLSIGLGQTLANFVADPSENIAHL